MQQPPSPATGPAVGQLLVGLGLVLVLVGLVAWKGGLAWFGRLPGDVRIERGGARFYAPIASMLVVSLALTAVLRLVSWFRGRWRNARSRGGPRLAFDGPDPVPFPCPVARSSSSRSAPSSTR